MQLTRVSFLTVEDSRWEEVLASVEAVDSHEEFDEGEKITGFINSHHIADKQSMNSLRLTLVTRSAILAASSSLKAVSKTTITSSPPALLVVLKSSKESPWHY